MKFDNCLITDILLYLWGNRQSRGIGVHGGWLLTKIIRSNLDERLLRKDVFYLIRSYFFDALRSEFCLVRRYWLLFIVWTESRKVIWGIFSHQIGCQRAWYHYYMGGGLCRVWCLWFIMGIYPSLLITVFSSYFLRIENMSKATTIMHVNSVSRRPGSLFVCCLAIFELYGGGL